MGPIGSFVSWILNLYWYLIVARILMSWFPDVSKMGIGQFIYRVTEPYLAPFRRFVPPLPLGGMYLDISVYAALIAYYFAESGLLWLLNYLLQSVGLS